MVEVTIDESKGDTISIVLGISEERAKQLRRNIFAGMSVGTTYTESMQMIADRCDNNNELAYTMFVYGQIAQRQRDEAEGRARHEFEKTDEDFNSALKKFMFKQ